jgi:hypothetical protein
MANAWLATVSNVFAWATRECLPDPLTGDAKPILEENPCDGVKRVAAPKSADPDEETGHPTFSDDDLAKFEAAYPLGTRERLTYSVVLFTGFRIGDAARFGRQHVQRDGTIKIKTEKTGTAVEIAITPPLQRALAAGPHGRPEVLNFLTSARGKAWDKTYSRLVVRRRLLARRPRPLGARPPEGLGAALCRARRDRSAAYGHLRVERPLCCDALRGDGQPQDHGARRAAGDALGRKRGRRMAFPHPGFRWGNRRQKLNAIKGAKFCPNLHAKFRQMRLPWHLGSGLLDVNMRQQNRRRRFGTLPMERR